MKRLLSIILAGIPVLSMAQGAAPSSHLTYTIPNDAVLKMNKVKITQTYYDDYYETLSFSGGYAGIQHTQDSSKTGSSHIFISSLWDPNTAGGIYSSVDYAAPGTYTGRFGGEGDGYQSINPINWQPNIWYNTVVRSWISNGRLHIASFIQNQSTNIWRHTITLSVPSTSSYLGSGNDAFIENWVSSGTYAGQTVRKMYLKDSWNLTAAGAWQKPTSRYFSSNSNDSARNGQYNMSFNAGYDSTQDAYFMQHGGNTTPSAAFNGGRVLNLPDQIGQGASPTLTTGSVASVNAAYNNGNVIVSWLTDTTKSPQFSAKVDILNSVGTVVATYKDTLPQRRADTITVALTSNSTYTARVSIVDIFNQSATPVSASFNTNASSISTTAWYKIRNAYSGKYLSVKDSSNNNSAGIVQYTSSNSQTEQWQFVSVGTSYQLVNRKSGKGIDISGSNQAQGVQPIQYVSTGNLNQQWNMISVGTNTYNIQSNMSNHYVLDDSASSTNDGTAIIIYGSSGGTNQQWVLEQVTTTNGLAYAPQDNFKVAQKQNFYQLWPNPVQSTLHFSVANDLIGTKAYIYSKTGTLTKSVNISGSSIVTSVSELPSGIYFIKLADGNNLKFIKE